MKKWYPRNQGWVVADPLSQEWLIVWKYKWKEGPLSSGSLKAIKSCIFVLLFLSATIPKCHNVDTFMLNLIFLAETTNSSSYSWSRWLITVPGERPAGVSGAPRICLSRSAFPLENLKMTVGLTFSLDIIVTEFMMWELLHWSKM